MVSLHRRVPHHARNHSNAYAPAITAQMTMATTKPQRSTGLIYSLWLTVSDPATGSATRAVPRPRP
jgi:hypothetical protein